ncbi:single-stranded DNA-binding protein [Candidatus Bipolaricaulota bacterium]|nr:single-stranded DNA-binding protein [Candidatus Bipolaricaulota bacterium]
MSDVNRVILTGRLTSDPDLRYTPTGKAVARFDLAVNRRWMNPETGQLEEEVTFVPVVVWGKQAETCAAWLRKGRQVAVDGRLRIRSFETQNGDRRRVTEVVAQTVHFLGPKPEAPEVPEPPAGEETYPEEEVPF